MDEKEETGKRNIKTREIMGCRVKERAIQEKMIKGDGRKVIEDYRVRKKKDERGKEE